MIPPWIDLKFGRCRVNFSAANFCDLRVRVHATLRNFEELSEPTDLDFVAGVDAASTARAGIG
jgi:hypothetical protein